MTTVVLGPDVLGPLGTLNKRFAALTGQFDPQSMASGPGQVLPGPRGDLLGPERDPARARPPGAGPGLRRGRVPVPVRAAGAVTASPGRTRSSVDLGGVRVLRRLRTGRVHHRDVRRQLELARARVDAGELHHPAQPAAQRPIPRRRVQPSSTPPAAGSRPTSRTAPRTCAAGSSPCSCAARTGGDPATGRSTGSRTTRGGGTTSPSSSTSTATTAPGWAPPTRPGGPGSWPT